MTTLAALALLMWVVFPLLKVSAQAGESSSAADAAALAGAQRVREAALDAVRTLPVGTTLGSALPPSVGIEAAAQYAERNGTRVVPGSYRADLGRDRVRVQVELPEAGETSTYRSAEAQVGVWLDRCTLGRQRVIVGYQPPPTPTPTPTPSPSPSPTATPSPTPPPPPIPIYGWHHTFTCRSDSGATLVSFGPDPSADTVRTAMRSWLDGRLTPALVQ
ncbi:hypothetical protein [Cellulomonas xiejunii]|uniref:Flp pilus-assembly TadG-like N-terminal domain-containing protein n=1 Tax=Cellulomonas xiejunii TaxID=2968083 RepID=A0ABY5KLJ1_9CELL|nr:hypothetical protein [Cellulomonas xiejunii]MCC2312732.1 hypothetical protein [Cellulomonas xiejunii]MCC2320398.1 hypothetical protein [Cellulomonas xiejunii]UUI70695.1 hypothetical protein NP048_12935 [Cellulomonas xiejunii]